MTLTCYPFRSSKGTYKLPPAGPQGQTSRVSTDSYSTLRTTPITKPLERTEAHTSVKTEPKPSVKTELQPSEKADPRPSERAEPSQTSEKVEPSPTSNTEPLSSKSKGKAPKPPTLEPSSPPPNTTVNAPKQGVFGGRISNAGKTPNEIKTPRYSKDQKCKQLIEDAILGNEFLKNLEPAQIKAVSEAMYSRTLQENSFLIQEGEIGSHLYVSAEGEFEIIKGGNVLGRFGTGVAFGELAILYNSKRQASIRVVVQSQVWVLDRRMFQQIMMRAGLQKIEDNIQFLRSVPLLEKLNKDALTKMSDLLKVEFYTDGQCIVKQGDMGNAFYIISGGTVEITKTEPGSQEERKIGELGKGQFFGELALLNYDVRQATITALKPGVECLVLESEPFKQLLGGLETLKDINWDKLFAPRNTKENIEAPITEYDYISLMDLKLVTTLGVGGFGRVELVLYEKENLTFAMKCLKKVHVVQQQQEQHAYSEKAVMLECKACPFISSLYRTYRDSKFVYFLMEPCLGGDVFTVLQKYHLFDDNTARFMTACVVEALEYLHGRGFIYRDLKPENLLLDSRGYIKMIDFGFAKRVGATGKTWTFAGTPEYVAPEIILNKGHDRAVDYWALGVFIHELLTGRPPFRGSDHMKTYNQILRGIEAVHFPKHITKPAQSLIRRLCRAVPTERLGYQMTGVGVQEIKVHRWFNNFNWEALKSGSMKAPITPHIKSNTDTRNFDTYHRDKDIPPDELSGWDKDF